MHLKYRRGTRVRDEGKGTRDEKRVTRGNIMNFYDLIAWQKACRLVQRIYLSTRKEEFKRDYSLASQIQRASVSVMSNIAEGHERDGASEFHRFLHMAKGSCAEVRSQLYVAYDIGYLSKDEFLSLLTSAEEVSRIIGGLRRAIRKRKIEKRSSRVSSLVPRVSSPVPVPYLYDRQSR